VAGNEYFREKYNKLEVALKEFIKTDSFKIIVIPSVLSILLVVGIDIHHSWLLTLVLIGGFVVFAVVFFALARRKQRIRAELGRGARFEGRFDVLIFSPSSPSPNPNGDKKPDDDGFDVAKAESHCKKIISNIDLLEKIKRYNTGRIVCLVSAEADAHHAPCLINEVFQNLKVESHDIARGDELMPNVIKVKCVNLIRESKKFGAVVVDITSGNKPTTVGMYEAAIEEGVSIGYISGDEVRIILDTRPDG
jgi:hypothetical protein